MQNWYQQLMPTVRDVKPFVKEFAKGLNNLKDVKSVMVWGTYSKNITKLSCVIKEVDFLIKTSFHSDDLLAVTTEDDEFSPLNIAPDELEDFGFNREVVAFTKKIKKPTKYPSNLWVMSKNQKLLHWGPIIDDHSEWSELQELAEKYASENTNTKSLNKQSQDTKDNWYSFYKAYLNNYVENMPNGWYIAKANMESIEESAVLL